MSDIIRTGPDLAALTTLGLGGPAGRLVSAASVEEIVSGVRAAVRDARPLLVLSGGSNVVVADEGFPGTVLLMRTQGWRVVRAGDEHVEVTVAAGQPWDEFVAETVAQGWSGMECLSGIPGAAGATPIQNVGAYGQDVSQTVVGVLVYDRVEGVIEELGEAECGFGYRSSRFKHSDRWVVLEVTFRLRRDRLSAPIAYAELARVLGTQPGERVPLEIARSAVLALRRGKGMLIDPSDPDTRSVGSFFTNPVLSGSGYQSLLLKASGLEPPSWPGTDGLVKVSAAWLIEQAGFKKGYRRGRAAISSKHTLALTNPEPDGTTGELLELAAEIRDGVNEHFGVQLHPEPVLVNCSL